MAGLNTDSGPGGSSFWSSSVVFAGLAAIIVIGCGRCEACGGRNLLLASQLSFQHLHLLLEGSLHLLLAALAGRLSGLGQLETA